MTPRDLKSIRTTQKSCRDTFPWTNMALKLLQHFYLLMEKPLGHFPWPGKPPVGNRHGVMLVLVQVIAKLNHKFTKLCLMKLLVLVWQAHCRQQMWGYAVGDFLCYLFYLWFVQVRALIYWSVVCAVITLV